MASSVWWNSRSNDWICYRCHVSFATSEELDQHFNELGCFRDAYNVKCNICDKAFSTKKKVREHKRDDHSY